MHLNKYLSVCFSVICVFATACKASDPPPDNTSGNNEDDSFDMTDYDDYSYSDDDPYSDYSSDDLLSYGPCDDYAEDEVCDLYYSDDVTNEFELEQLKDCKCIEGDLIIISEYLTGIELPLLELVDGDLTISSSDLLETVDMPRLKTVSYGLEFKNNDILDDVSFQSLEVVGGLIINNNDALTHLDGLSSLEKINEYSIWGGIEILNNASLETLDGLAGVTTLNAAVIIRNNSVLSDVSGLGNIDSFVGSSSWDEGLMITGNPSLSTCNAIDLRDTVSPENMPICIMENQEGDCDNDFSGC